VRGGGWCDGGFGRVGVGCGLLGMGHRTGGVWLAMELWDRCFRSRDIAAERVWGFLQPDWEVLSILPHRGVHHKEFLCLLTWLA